MLKILIKLHGKEQLLELTAHAQTDCPRQLIEIPQNHQRIHHQDQRLQRRRLKKALGKKRLLQQRRRKQVEPKRPRQQLKKVVIKRPRQQQPQQVKQLIRIPKNLQDIHQAKRLPPQQQKRRWQQPMRGPCQR